jgi:hypothetical protein
MVMIAAALVTRGSFVDDISQKSYIDSDEKEIKENLDLNDAFKFRDVDYLSELIESADAIVKVKVNADSERNFFADNTISEVSVMDVYKGNIEDESISVIEPVYYWAEGDVILATEGYYWMREGQEYILFLQELEDAHLGNHKMIYLPTSTKFSKYNIKEADDLETSSNRYVLYSRMREQVLDYVGEN